MKISEDHLYHFTAKEHIKSILEEGFIPFFGPEFVQYDENTSRAEFFPRVCFTDLPLNLIEKHIKKYDDYAFGMKKEWAINKGLNPLFYIQKNSYVGATLSMLKDSIQEFHTTLRKNKNSPIELEVLFQRLNNLNLMMGRYTKPYELDNKIKVKYASGEKIFNADRYYDEREWRYVPYISREELVQEGVSPFEKADKINLDKLSKKHTLNFELNDIFSVVVPKESEIDFVVNLLSERFKVKESLIHEKIDFKVV